MNFFKWGNEKISVKRTPESGKKTDFHIKDKKLISTGGFYARDGVHSAEVYLKKDKKRRGVPVVIKQYGEKNVGLFEKIAKSHAQMKADGLKVPRTLRYDPKGNRTIMTDFNQNDRIALSGSNNPSELVKEHSLESIPGFDKLIDALIEHALQAAKQGYSIPADSYLLLVPQGAEGETDFVIGDFDVIRKIDFQKSDNGQHQGLSKQSLILRNLTLLKIFIEEFCYTWLDTRDNAKKYIAQAEDRIKAIRLDPTRVTA